MAFAMTILQRRGRIKAYMPVAICLIGFEFSEQFRLRNIGPAGRKSARPAVLLLLADGIEPVLQEANHAAVEIDGLRPVEAGLIAIMV
jgi:hypothetical protein